MSRMADYQQEYQQLLEDFQQVSSQLNAALSRESRLRAKLESLEARVKEMIEKGE